ncbi:hypothetical protein Glove_261g70 [Diversispora epigaea]|uniref:Oxidoreductase-like domain-containing protein n=1 Tax=Diversispora epigaea TaxID=1348612 RepID=A0A397I7T6_9GLOM|nr:hypothetical protein Glove_261g70 [Diversispora epigaea]
MFQATKNLFSNPNYKSVYQYQFKRSIKSNEDKKYDGYWTLILRQHALSRTEQNESQNKSSIASISIDSDNKEESPTFKEETLIYTVDRELIPPKPAFPDNCCMSGCSYCVLDIYQEEMQEWNKKIKEIKSRLLKEKKPLPTIILEQENKSNGNLDNEMDPGMKAFLELEKKLLAK